MEGAAKAVAVLNRPSIGEVAKTPSSTDGLARPSIHAFDSPEGVDLIEVSSNLSP